MKTSQKLYYYLHGFLSTTSGRLFFLGIPSALLVLIILISLTLRLFGVDYYNEEEAVVVLVLSLVVMWCSLVILYYDLKTKKYKN